MNFQNEEQKDGPAEPVYIGIDLSLNTWGIVMMRGEKLCWGFLTDRKKYIFKNTDYLQVHYTMPDAKYGTKEQRTAERRHMAAHSVYEALCGHVGPDTMVNIEHYAYSAQSTTSAETGELGGLIREWLFVQDIAYRQTAPTSLQKWAVKGRCTKEERIRQAEEELGFKTDPRLLTPCKKANGLPDLTGPGTDVVDALWLAHMMKTEDRVRKGLVDLSSLPQNRRDILLATSKEYKENRLTRPLVQRPEHFRGRD